MCCTLIFVGKVFFFSFRVHLNLIFHVCVPMKEMRLHVLVLGVGYKCGVACLLVLAVM